MKVLITGASGYIGRFLSWQLEKEHELRLTDFVEPDPDRLPWVYQALQIERKPEYLPKPSASIPFHKGNLLDMDFLKRMTEGMDAVIHLAGHVKPNEEPVECFKVNALGTFMILQACVENGVNRALCASSINASGWFYCRITDRPRNWPYLPADEAMAPDHEDAYSLAKYCNELNCQAWTNRVGMTTAAFRFAGVFPPEWTETFKDKVQPTTEWPGELGNYVDLRDVTGGLRQALECETLPKFGVYQLTAPDTTLPEPSMEIIERFRPELLKNLKSPLPGRTTMLSHENARKGFGYSPKHCWKEV